MIPRIPQKIANLFGQHIILVLILAIYVFIGTNFMLYNPKIWPDETYLADTANNILNKGRINTNVWGDMFLGVKDNLYWIPPIYLYVLAAWFKIFGFSIISQRALSITLGGLLFILIYYLLKSELKLKTPISLKQIPIFLIIIALIFDNTFLKGARIGRVEILVLLLGTFSIIVYQLLAKIPQRLQSYTYVFIGLICGITTLTHLLGGSLFLAAILLDQFIKKRFRFLFSKQFLYLFGGFVTPLFVWLISVYPNYYVFLKQLSLQRHFRRIVEPYILSVFRYEVLEIKLSYIIYAAVTLINIKKSFAYKRYTIFTLITIFGWMVYLFGKLEWYAIYFVPFLYLLSAFLIYKSFFEKKDKPIVSSSNLLIFLLMILFLLNIKVYLNKSQEYKMSGNYYRQFSSLMENYIPKDSTVYLSTIPDFYFFLKDNYRLYEAPVMHPRIDKYVELLNNSDFVVINYHIEHMFVGNILFRYLELNTKKEYDLPQIGDILPIKVIELSPKNNRAKP